MGDNVPDLGERVVYEAESGPVFATVIAVTFWDLVDLELDSGKVLRNVRRRLDMCLGESDLGRFYRIVPRKG